MAFHRSGFSLVELSIVLVILGLLTGGILVGQNLIRAAELRAVTTEFNNYQTAVMTFRDRYFAMPGDMTNATDFWGAINSTHSTCIATASPDNKATCNGDGDGYINVTTSYATQGYERYHHWLHLANAGLIEGSYNGLTSTAGTFAYERDVNSPASKLGSAYWVVVSLVADNTDNTHANRFPRVFNFKVLYTMYGGNMTGAEYWGIDKKIDDGRPATGNVWFYKASGAGADCTTSDSLDAEYDLGNTETTCYFVGGF